MLRRVGEIGLQSQDDSRGLKQREPAGDRLRVNVGVVCDVRHVEGLARPSSRRHEEAVGLWGILDLVNHEGQWVVLEEKSRVARSL